MIVEENIAGFLPGTKKDAQSITKDWESLQPLIEGVHIREMKNVIKHNGSLVELYREEWGGVVEVKHVFQEFINPQGITAWHLHHYTTDQLFVSVGTVKIVLYDAREGSKTKGLLNVFHYGSCRPGIVVVPPGVWHGVMNVGADMALLVNLTDKVYEYEDPDHYRLPPDTDEIPYRFYA